MFLQLFFNIALLCNAFLLMSKRKMDSILITSSMLQRCNDHFRLKLLKISSFCLSIDRGRFLSLALSLLGTSVFRVSPVDVVDVASAVVVVVVVVCDQE